MIRNLISNAIKFTGKNGKVQVTTEIGEVDEESNNISTDSKSLELRRMKPCRNSVQKKLLRRRFSQFKYLSGLQKDTDADSVDGQLRNQKMLVLKVTDSGAGISAVSHSLFTSTRSFICNWLYHSHIHTSGKSKEVISFCGSI